MCLSYAWVIQSMKGPNQTDFGLWQELQDVFHIKFGMERTAGELRVKWKTMASEEQIYLSVRKCVYSNPRSGTATDGCDECRLSSTARELVGKMTVETLFLHTHSNMSTHHSSFLTIRSLGARMLENNQQK